MSGDVYTDLYFDDYSIPDLAVKVEVLFDTSGAYFGSWFTVEESALDGEDPLAGDTLVDLTAYTMSVKVHRGRSRDLDEFTAGSATVVFKNDSRYFDPDNPDSPFYGQIQPVREVHVSATLGDLEYPLFVGYAQDWEPDEAADGQPTVTLVAADALSLLAMQELGTIAEAHSGDLSGARVSRVLNLPEVAFPADIRDIDAGRSTFGPTTFGSNAAAYLQACATSEGGALYIENDGTLRFKQRYSVGSTVEATFSDDADPDHIPYQAFKRSFAVDMLYTRVVCSGTSGTEKTAVSDADTLRAYKIRTLARTGQLVLSDSEMQDQADYLLSRFEVPELRFKQLYVMLAAAEGVLPVARIAELLALDLTSRVVAEKEITASTTVTQDATVDGLDWEFRPAFAAVTVTVSSSSRLHPWVLEDATLGVLESTARLGY